MKEVNMYIASSCYPLSSNKEGSFVTALEYKGKTKIIKGKDINTTSYRMLIQAIIDGVKLLKEPCIIKLYSPIQVGLARLKGKKGKETKGVRNGYNQDLLLILKQELVKGNHQILENITNKFVFSLKQHL